jgi:hypothetical protein
MRSPVASREFSRKRATQPLFSLYEVEIMNSRTTDHLVRIASAGAGFRICAVRGTNDLVRIVAAASSHQARIVIYGTDGMTTDDLVRVGAAGKGTVFFE